MKTKVLLIAIMLTLGINAYSQFVTKPLHFPNTGDYYLPIWISPVDVDHVWVGTIHVTSTNDWDTYTYAVHSNDAGETWIFDSIPVPGLPIISNVSAIDENTCYYAFTDLAAGNGSIWKTSDGGATWVQKTTTQFQGGFLDSYHAFNANEGIAIGDPNGGYLEIHRTTDGGDTWIRIAQGDIPSNDPGEYAITDAFSTYGDIIWFSTNKSHCYKSIDQGQHWTVSTVPTAMNYDFASVAFANTMDGIFFGLGYTSQFYRTSDGGSTWAIDSLPNGDVVWNADGVNGLDGGLVISSWDSITGFVKVYFTPDFFSTLIVLDSNLVANSNGIRFSDPQTGWLAGVSNNANGNILKYNGILTSVQEAAKTPERLSIMPNPSSAETLIKIPASLDSKPILIRILDMNGREVEQRTIASSTGWTKLNASGYSNGIYLVGVISGNYLIAEERWVVNH